MVSSVRWIVKLNVLLSSLVIVMGQDALDELDRVVHGELAGDVEGGREETELNVPELDLSGLNSPELSLPGLDPSEFNSPELSLPELDLSPPPDVVPPSLDTAIWDLEESELAPDVEKVDEWEALPLPASHHQAQLMRDSEEYGRAGSEAKREAEEEMAEAARELEGAVGAVEGREAGWINDVGKMDIRVVLEDIVIFNCDDFDGRESDVEGDSPMVPR